MADLARIPKALTDDAPPPMMAAAMPSAPPDMGPAPAPLVSRIPTMGEQNLAHDQARLQKIQMAEARPWGFEGAGPSAEFPEGLAPNHPGKLGKVAHAFSMLGNIAGNIVAPNMMARIPNTQANMAEQEGALANRVNTEQTAEGENQERQALTNKTNVEAGLEPGKAASLEAEQGAQTKNLESETGARQQALDMGPSLIQGHAHAVNQALKAGKDPATDPLVQQYEDAIQRLQAENVPKEANPQQQTFDDLVKGGMSKEQAWEKIRERPAVIGGGDSLANRRFDAQQKGAALKLYQPALDSAERFNVMSENYEKAVKDHDQQAMLSLLANHLGMTMGLQKGARITRDLYQEAAKSTPWLSRIGAKFDDQGYLSGVTLNPQQMRQMVSLGQSRFQQDLQKSRNEGAYTGVGDDGPERTPNKSTMRYYLAQANGNAQQAKQLAAQDGWTVK